MDWTEVQCIVQQLLELERDGNPKSSDDGEKVECSWLEYEVPTECDKIPFRSIAEKNVGNVKHALHCLKVDCSHLKCTEIKDFLQHKKRCKLCKSCKFFIYIMCMHAIKCQDDRCDAPHCVDYKCLREAVLLRKRTQKFQSSALPPPHQATSNIYRPGVKKTPASILLDAVKSSISLMNHLKKMEPTSETNMDYADNEFAEIIYNCPFTDDLEEIKGENRNSERKLEILEKEIKQVKSKIENSQIE